MVETTASKSKKENIHPFTWNGTLQDVKNKGLAGLDEGLEAYVKSRGYRHLPGGVAPLMVWETDNPSERFLVTATYPEVTLFVLISNAYMLQTFMQAYMGVATILPEIAIPAPVAPPNNTIVTRRGLL